MFIEALFIKHICVYDFLMFSKRMLKNKYYSLLILRTFEII